MTTRKSIKLAHGIDRVDTDMLKDYKVLVVKNSTRYHPGEIMTTLEVSDLCDNANWDVTIVSYRYEMPEA